MKQTIQKYIYMLGLTLAALALLLLCMKSAPEPGASPSGEITSVTKVLPEQLLRIRTGENQTVSLWTHEDGCHYAFLPAHASKATLVLQEGTEASLGNVSLQNGMDLSGFAANTDYPLTVNGQDAGTLCFLRSANVPTLYIETQTGSLEQIHADKNNEEGAGVMLVSPEGLTEYSSAGCMLKGRGNVTWLAEKRPYLLTLPEEAGLLGMGAATKWVLLANAVDETNLRNKLIYDLAAETGFAWTPDCEFVDVYVNGEYRGLYLLAEKVEAGANRLHLDTAAGDFLCRVDVDFRWGDLRYPFRTPSGRTVEISDPKQLTTGARESIGARVATLEERIFSGEDLSKVPDFDLDSWVRRYLVDEISGNIDADLASSYFYCRDGVFYGGPAWDYDKTLGNTLRNRDPRTFTAKNRYISATIESPYYDALYRNESFRKHVPEIYREEFRPVLEELLTGGIREQAEHIREASCMNNLRWQHVFRGYYTSGEIYPSDVETLTEHLARRVEFLDSAWIEGVDYCTVQLEYAPGGPYWNVTVKKGTLLRDIPGDVTENIWYDTWTGENVGPDTAITEDRVLTVRYEAWKETTAVLVTLLSVGFFAVLLVLFVAADFLLRRKERRKDHAKSKSRVSS